MKKDIEVLAKSLFITFDGSSYEVLNVEPGEYRVGEIICELDRATASVDRIIENIVRVSNFAEPSTTDGITIALNEIQKNFCTAFGSASGTMLVTELSWAARRYVKEIIDGRDVSLPMVDKVKQELLKKAGISEMGIDTIGQVLFSGFISWYRQLLENIKFNSMVMTVLEYTNDPKAKIYEMGQELFFEKSIIKSQNYDYRIVNLEGKLTSVIGLKDSYSLILFEIANCLNNSIELKQCKHCGRHFPLYGRSDTVYCSFPFGKDGKTCREIGAQATRTEKLRNDVAASEYRKLYLRIKMQVRRHPEDNTLKDLLERFMAEGKEYRRKLDANEITEEEYLEWLKKTEMKYKRKK